MKTNGALFPAVVLLLLSGSLQAEEPPVKSRIVSVGLFKNGLAVVHRAVTVDGPGTYRLDDVPEPVHGTYWVESSAQVETQVKMREVEVPAGISGDVDLQKELAGRKVTVHFHSGNVPPATGVVAELKPPKNDEGTPAAVRLRRGAGYADDGTPAAPARYLVLQTAKGRAYLDSSQIALVEAEGQPDKVKQRRPVLELTVDQAEKKPIAIHVTYLARGIAWAPSYRVDISDPKTLSLEQAAVVKNELADLDNAEVFLISGFPSVQFAHVTSPLSARTSWALFFQELSQRFNPAGDVTGNSIVSQQAVVSTGSPLSIDMSATPSGEGVDLHFQSIGKRTLAEGDSLALTVGRGKAGYERIVEWLVPDNRDEFGQQVARERGGEDPDAAHEGAWDALRFRNPLSFPMTTGPAVVVANGRFNGERTSYWVNPGEETILHINKALSVRTRSIEQEEQKKNGDDEREIIWVGGRRFRKATVQGELMVSNHRQEAITLVLRRRFSGELLSAEGAPKSTLREEGVYSVNKRNELLWSFPLKAGEEKKLQYRYAVLVSF
jgi:hypothetical protein